MALRDDAAPLDDQLTTGSRDRVQAMRYAYSRGYAQPAPPS